MLLKKFKDIPEELLKEACKTATDDIVRNNITISKKLTSITYVIYIISLSIKLYR